MPSTRIRTIVATNPRKGTVVITPAMQKAGAHALAALPRLPPEELAVSVFLAMTAKAKPAPERKSARHL